MGWLGCLAQGCPEVAPSPRLCADVSCARATSTSPLLREWSLLPQTPGSEPWHSQATGDLPSMVNLTTANYLHGYKFSTYFHLLQGDALPRTRTNLSEQDFSEELSSPGSEHLTWVSTISSLKCCSTQRAALSPSVFSFSVHNLFECVLMPSLQQILRFKKNLKAEIFSGKTLCHFTTAADTDLLCINLVPTQTICGLDISCMDLLKGSRTMWERN